ncbi:MAG: permease-like cell division protein FtsX [bacterium]|nr:permease-like cell division protein FtsX [bacterium]
MATLLFRILKYGFQNFWRNGWLSTATVAVMIIALLVFLGLRVFDTVMEGALISVRDKIDISVYFKTNAPEDEILKIQRSLESLPEVKQVEYISRDKALDLFREKHKDDSTIPQALTVIGENPLSASLNIKANDPEKYGAIASYLEAEAFKPYINEEGGINKAQNQVVIERLVKIINAAEKTGFALTAFLAFVAGLVTFNTIRLAIYSNREEIGIMRLVGASNAFIRGPYIVEGAIQGGVAAAISLLIAAPLISLAAPYLTVFIPDSDLGSYFKGEVLILFGYQLLFGIGLGTISSFIAIRRYLKV